MYAKSAVLVGNCSVMRVGAGSEHYTMAAKALHGDTFARRRHWQPLIEEKHNGEMGPAPAFPALVHPSQSLVAVRQVQKRAVGAATMAAGPGHSMHSRLEDSWHRVDEHRAKIPRAGKDSLDAARSRVEVDGTAQSTAHPCL